MIIEESNEQNKKPGPYGKTKVVPVSETPRLIFTEVEPGKDYFYNLTVYFVDSETEVYKAWNRPTEEEVKLAPDGWYQTTSESEQRINQPIRVWCNPNKSAIIAYQLAEAI